MPTLYVKNFCQYCERVLRFAAEKNVALEIKNISLDKEIADELIERGGKRQVPYLIDNERSISMYESAEIIDYLESNYAH